MTLEMMKIPKKINVGYQERKDTYTGKLAYVVYTDEKGVLRKESSWNSWKDEKIPVSVFDNVPTSGFVVNKKVGDYRSDWNHRKAHIRMYDPRGFEFEISVENMLYILEECNSIKGKGVEGEFIYAWDKADLVLLPVTAQEYTSSSKFTNMQTGKVGKKDIVEGCVYINKNMQEVMYLGCHELFEYSVRREDSNNDKSIVNGDMRCTTSHNGIGKKHIFVLMKPPEPKYHNQIVDRYWIQTGFTKLASKISDEISSTFATEYDIFKKLTMANKCKEVVVTPYTLNRVEQNENTGYAHGRCFIANIDGVLSKVDIDQEYDPANGRYYDNMYVMYNRGVTITITDDTVIEYTKHIHSSGYNYYSRARSGGKRLTLDELNKVTFVHIDLRNEYNQTLRYETY